MAHPNALTQPDPAAQLLVAIMNNLEDFRLARDNHWYRVPVSSQRKWLVHRWPPAWIAFYQTKLFGSERYSVRYFARVLRIRQQFGYELLPEYRDPRSEKGQRRYWQLMLDELRSRENPVFSRKLRRITFITTTLGKFLTAEEINDLFDDSPLENAMWTAMKRAGIPAERQFLVTAGEHNFFLDFAVRCAAGNIDIETDGDRYHANPEGSAEDNLRNNALAANRWHVLRFTTTQVQEQLESYCIPNITETINKLGGVDRDGELARLINLPEAGRPFQPGLFD